MKILAFEPPNRYLIETNPEAYLGRVLEDGAFVGGEVFIPSILVRGSWEFPADLDTIDPDLLEGRLLADDRLESFGILVEDEEESGEESIERHLPGKHDQKTPGRGGEAFPGHTILQDEVDDFLRDSAVKQPVYHWTSPEAAENIRKNGIDVERGNGLLGQGFYMTSAGDLSGGRHGRTRVTIAVRMENPLVVDYGLPRQFTQDITNPLRMGVEIRERILAAGHDGVIYPRAGNEPWYVALKKESVRVVRD